MSELLHADLTYKLRGIGFKIYNALGNSHPEKIYEDALKWQLEADKVNFSPQPAYSVIYKGKKVGKYIPDMMLEDGKVAIELKAAPTIEAIHKAQSISYLAVTNAELCLIMNFGAPSMQFERLPNFLGHRKSPRSDWTRPSQNLYPAITELIVEGLSEVHQTLGPGFLHQVYRRASLHELPQRGLAIEYIDKLPIRYEGYLLDMSPTHLIRVENKILLATVALTQVNSRHTAFRTDFCLALSFFLVGEYNSRFRLQRIIYWVNRSLNLPIRSV